MKKLICVLLMSFAAATDGSRGEQTPGSDVTVSLPLLDLRGRAAESAAAQDKKPAADGRLRLAVTVAGRSEPILLPMSADTYLWKNQDKSFGSAEILATANGDLAVTLLKPDLSELKGIQPAEMRDVRLTFTAGWKLRDGTATLTAYRMLTEWSEEATWRSPRPGAEWNGPRAGVDYDKAPAGTWTTPALKTGPAEVQGLGDTLRKWMSGEFPANGLLMRFSGSAGQVNLLAREREAKIHEAELAALTNPPAVRLSAEASSAIAILNVPLLRQAVLAPSDLNAAELRVKLVGTAGKLASARLDVHRMLGEPEQWRADSPLAPGRHFDAQPLATISLTRLPQDNWIRIPIPGAALQSMMQNQSAGLLLMLAAGGEGRIDLATPRHKQAVFLPSLRVTLARHANHVLFDLPVRLQEGVFVRVKDGHFDYGGQRLRLWGVAMNQRPNPEMADRLRKMGFNAVRLWGPSGFYAKDPADGKPVASAKGDASKLDEYDRLFAAFREQGFFVDFTALMELGPVSTAENSWLRDVDGDWERWKAAYLDKAADATVKNFAPSIDERLMRARKRHISNILSHVNPYTGKSYGQEEAIALFELANERAYIKRLLEKGVEGWPAYFRDKLQRRWNDWLIRRYSDDQGLEKAWGKLAENERLAAGSVRCAPALAERTKYPAVRASDWIRFLVELIGAYNKELETHARSCAPAGTGVAVAPFSYDTQFQPSVPWLYTIAQGDVANFGMYFWPLTSALTAPPSFYVMDSHTVAGKPTVIYETNASRPNPYRAEYPLRQAALACWQDWDAVFWHYFYGIRGESPVPDEQYAVSATKYMSPTFGWSAVEFETDPVMHAAIALAGQMFLRGLIAPAPEPATYVVGRDALFSYEHFNGLAMGRATMSRGARIRFAPEKAGGVRVEGVDESSLRTRISDAVASGDQILWDWPRGRLIIDTPTAKAYVGRTQGLYRFKDGIVVGDFSTPFVSFALVSADGQPLAGANPSRRVFVSAVADARNSGFEMDSSIAKPDGMFIDPAVQARAIRSPGHAPVIQDPVGFRIWWPRSWRGRLRGYDFALRKTGERAIDANVLRHDGTPFWLAMLEIEEYGAPAKVPQVAAVAAPATAEARAATTSPATRSAASPRDEIWNPLPGLSWADPYDCAHQVLRDGSFTLTRISAEDKTDAPDKTITLTEAEVLFEAPANIQIYFRDDRMTHIDATFVRPPALRELIAAIEKQFGPPVEKHIAETADKTSTARWRKASGSLELDITVTETQGTLNISYALSNR